MHDLPGLWVRTARGDETPAGKTCWVPYRAAPRGTVAFPTVNVDAQTNPRAKTTTTARYVHGNRISGRFSGGDLENMAEKIARACAGPSPVGPSSAGSRR